MAKKKTLSEVFITNKSLKRKEVFNAIKKYCKYIKDEDLKEIHENVIEYFELKEGDYYFSFENFNEDINLQKTIKLENENKKMEKQ